MDTANNVAQKHHFRDLMVIHILKNIMLFRLQKGAQIERPMQWLSVQTAIGDANLARIGMTLSSLYMQKWGG